MKRLSLFMFALFCMTIQSIAQSKSLRKEMSPNAYRRIASPVDNYLSKKKGTNGSTRPTSKVSKRAGENDLQPVTIPEGLVVEDYTLRAWHYRYNEEWKKFSKGQYIDNDEAINIKVGFDGKDVYIQGFFDRYIPNAWIKGTMNEDETAITFKTQYYGTYNEQDRYFFGWTEGNIDSDDRLLSGDVVFQYDKATSTLILPSTMEIADSNNGDTWWSSDSYVFIVITKGYQEQESIVVPPDGLHVEDYFVSASNVSYDDNGNIYETPNTYGVKIGFDGNDVYIKGLSQNIPDAWIKGSLTNGKLTIAANQFLGLYENREVFIAGIPVNYKDRMELEDIILDYDSNTKVFSGGYEQFILVNFSKVCLYWLEEYLNVTIDDEEPINPIIPVPNGYLRVGKTDLCYRKNSRNFAGDSYAIDIKGKYGDIYYRSTYNDCGYDVAMQVGDGSAVKMDCLNGSNVNGIKFEADVIPQADLARVCYYITNTNDYDTSISLGIHADVMIGDNDSAPIIRKVDTNGNTYGLALLNGNGAQLCVMFGSGLTGVTSVSDFWFGGWSSNSSADEMVGNYSQGNNWMIENSSYDSGMGWCWKNRTIPAGATVTFSWLIGVGDVKLEPNSNFEVTPEDPDGWNDLSRLHVLAMEGDYESPAGLAGRIEYAVENSEEWIALTEMLESGSTFQDTVRAMFDPTLANHTIRFRTVDQVGNTTLLPSIVYPDVSYHALGGITDMIYTGDSLFQTATTCDLNADYYDLKNYQNNVNVGTASFSMEGVFPYTIGRKTYTFTIKPQPLSGNLVLTETSYVYSGQTFTPDWYFSNSNYANLEYDRDYTFSWSNNRLPGTATLTVTGKGNYTGSLSATFTIDKAQLTSNLFTLTLPDEDVTYDEQGHGATISKSNGVGIATISYTTKGQLDFSTEQPVSPGEYDIYLEIADGPLYYGMSRVKVGSFAIFQFDAAEWEILQTIKSQLVEKGWTQPWDMSNGMKSVSSLAGLTIREGHVIGLDLSNNGLTGAFPASILELPQLQSLNVANNQLNGNIGQYTESFTSLTTLDASGNCFDEVTPMIPATVTTLNLGSQTIDKTLDLNLANLTSEYILSQVPNILLYNHAQQTYSTNIRLLCATADNTWSMRLISQNGQVTLSTVSEDNAFRGQSGDTLNVAVLKSNNTLEGSTFRLKLSFEQGDGNFDGQINVLDLQTTINYMFEEYTTKPFNFTAANLWEDNVINVQDAVSLVNLLLEPSSASARMQNRARRTFEVSSDVSANVFIDNGKLIISSAVPVASFDIVVSSGQEWTVAEELSQIGFACMTRRDGNRIHLIGYSLNGMTLPVGQTMIGETSNGTISYAMLADGDAQEIPSTTNTNTTGIQSTIVDPDSKSYRLSIGANRAIMIDANGKKTMTKNEK